MLSSNNLFLYVVQYMPSLDLKFNFQWLPRINHHIIIYITVVEFAISHRNKQHTLFLDLFLTQRKGWHSHHEWVGQQISLVLLINNIQYL